MSKKPSIANDLAPLEISEQVKIEANNIFQTLNIPTKRKANRTRVIFFCVFMAYQNLGKVEEPRVIAKSVGLQHKEISKAFSICSKLHTDYVPTFTQKTPQDFVPIIINKLGIDTEVEEIVELLQEVLDKDPSLKDDFPQTVAAACVSFFLEIKGIKFPRSEIAHIIERSDMTLQKICNKVTKAYNN